MTAVRLDVKLKKIFNAMLISSEGNEVARETRILGTAFFFYTSILILRGGLTFALLSCMYSRRRRYNVYVGLSTLKMQIDTGRSGMATTIVRVTAAHEKQ